MSTALPSTLPPNRLPISSAGALHIRSVGDELIAIYGVQQVLIQQTKQQQSTGNNETNTNDAPASHRWLFGTWLAERTPMYDIRIKSHGFTEDEWNALVFRIEHEEDRPAVRFFDNQPAARNIIGTIFCVSIVGWPIGWSVFCGRLGEKERRRQNMVKTLNNDVKNHNIRFIYKRKHKHQQDYIDILML